MKRTYLYLDKVPYFHMVHPVKQIHIINLAAQQRSKVYYILPYQNETKNLPKGPGEILYMR